MGEQKLNIYESDSLADNIGLVCLLWLILHAFTVGEVNYCHEMVNLSRPLKQSNLVYCKHVIGDLSPVLPRRPLNHLSSLHQSLI